MKSKLFIFITMLFVSCSQPKIDSKYVNIDFRNLEIKDFVAYVSKVTGTEIKMEEEIKGKINFVSNEHILKTELISLANAILETKRMSLVNKGEQYTVVKTEDYKGIGCSFDYLGKPSGPMKTVSFELHDLNMAVVRTKIKPLLHKGSKVLGFRDENLLAITADSQTLDSIGKLIGKLRERKNKE